ncbi:MAG: endopeptidase La [Armatimonadetes bacterium]|nr:endopeptidase La [Armatimonadota bacterium]
MTSSKDDTMHEQPTITDLLDQLDNDSESRNNLPNELNLLPLREVVIFPVLVAPLGVGRENSVKLVNASVVGGNRLIGVASLKDSSVENPTLNDIYPIGTVVAIRMMGQTSEGIRLIVQGLSRFRVVEAIQTTPYLRVRIETIPEPDIPHDKEKAMEIEALRRQIGNLFKRAVSLSPELPDEMQGLVNNVEDPRTLTDLIAGQMPRLTTPERQEILETIDIQARMTKLMELLAREVQVLELGSKLESQVSTELGKSQREYYLREQMKAIQKELGEGDDRTQELEELTEKIEAAQMPEESLKEANRELDRLSRMNPAAPEYTVSRTYIDWLVALPWAVFTEDNLDIGAVKEVLDTDHTGLDKVKDRILEFLAVRKFKESGTMRQPILCFVGPPGVGKTSLGKSIAHALGRKFIRISLGGIRDEAEIRGHRRTYIGSLPGQIIQGIRRAGSNNPLFMLDEIDKVAADFRGDPSSALLEVLDPEQNNSFRDHYLEVPFDLSKVLFITTANVLDTILPPLRDRMEIIEIAGYTEEEKVAIAKQHLVPKQIAEHGIEGRIKFTEKALIQIVRFYTREAGVRNLEREIATICRKVTRAFAENKMERVDVGVDRVTEYLGVSRVDIEEAKQRASQPGVAIGLVWTPVGGDIIFIEATSMPGEKGFNLTGQLGDVMRESAQAALSYIRGHIEDIHAPVDFYQKHDIHIHVPAGSIPKDGPSAGVTMVAALASLFSGRPVKPLLAMTGEITLSGKVLPIGGVKEKVLAARRAGINTVILPERNRKDLIEDVPEEVRKELKFEYVSTIEEVLRLALDPASVAAMDASTNKSKNIAADTAAVA